MARKTTVCGALALLVAAACGKSTPGAGGSKGVADGTFHVQVQNGQSGGAALAIRGGRVYTDDLRLECGVDAAGGRLDRCDADFSANEAVVLHAAPSGADASFTPARPFLFLGWSGDCIGEGDCTLRGRADRYVVATFGAVRVSHASFADPAVHGAAWSAYAAGAVGALDCRSCHGARLEGQGSAISCAACHAWPRATGGALSWDAARWDESRWQ